MGVYHGGHGLHIKGWGNKTNTFREQLSRSRVPATLLAIDIWKREKKINKQEKNGKFRRLLAKQTDQSHSSRLYVGPGVYDVSRITRDGEPSYVFSIIVRDARACVPVWRKKTRLILSRGTRTSYYTTHHF